MKFIKWFFIVILAIIAAALIVAAFLPKSIDVKAKTEVSISPEKAFHAVASFSNREAWDPWLTMDSTGEAEYEVKDGYLGSVYTWKGEKIGTGKMRIDSIQYGSYIASSIYFRESPDASKVEWLFLPFEKGTEIIWKFNAEGKYPIGRLMLALMKNGLKQSLETGINNLKTELEENEVHLSSLSPIEIVDLPAINAMAGLTSGSMNEIMGNIEGIFNNVQEVIADQGLTIAGSPFGYYFNYNPNDNTTSAYFGVPVQGTGKAAEDVVFISLPATKAVKATHTGVYEDFEKSYPAIMKYIQENNLDATWEAFEFYSNDPMSTLPPFLKTDIYMTLK